MSSLLDPFYSFWTILWMLLWRRGYPRWLPASAPASCTSCSYLLLQVRRDWFAYSVLSALPWVGRELYEKKESELDRCLLLISPIIYSYFCSYHLLYSF